jgi:hypothetical protein
MKRIIDKSRVVQLQRAKIGVGKNLVYLGTAQPS